MRKITDRQAQLLKILSAGNVCHTVQKLGTFLGVSARTIARELDACGGYLKRAGLLLERRAEGVCLTGAQNSVAALRGELEKKTYVANLSQRLILLKLKILQQTEPMKLYVLSRELNVAESTISHDLNKVAAWVEGYSLRLTRRQGFGIVLEGKESDRRNALASLVYESLNDTLLVRWLTGEHLLNDHAKDAFLLQWMDAAMAAEIAAQLRILQYEDKHLVALTLHLLIIASRVKAGCPCESIPERKFEKLQQYQEAETLAKRLEETLAIHLPEEEICCIAVHLSTRCVTVGNDHQQRALLLARDFLLEVWEESGISFVYDEQMVESVANHLSAALHRLRLQMKIRNPLEKEIKECYRHSFDITRRALATIERRENLEIPDAEAAYLTMYLLAALEAQKTTGQKFFHIAVCCPLGMSSAVLLTSRIKSLYQNIKVDRMLSLSKLEDLPDVDLILSTVTCKFKDIEVLTVSPLFTEEDREKLNLWLGAHQPRKRAPDSPLELNWKDRLRQINAFSEELLRFSNHIFFAACDARDKEGIIRRAAAEAAGEDCRAVAEAIRAREAKGSVLVEEQHLLFLHARSEMIKELHFGVLRPTEDFSVEGVPIKTVVVMLVPTHATQSQVELLQKLTAMIAEAEAFQLLLQRCTGEQLRAALENIFRQYFKDKFMS